MNMLHDKCALLSRSSGALADLPSLTVRETLEFARKCQMGSRSTHFSPVAAAKAAGTSNKPKGAAPEPAGATFTSFFLCCGLLWLPVSRVGVKELTRCATAAVDK